MITENLKRQVMREAGNLRRYATKEEISKLNLRKLSPAFSDSCVYGQMTGDCYGKRAGKLIKECAVPVIGDFDFDDKGNDRYILKTTVKLLPTKMWTHKSWGRRIFGVRSGDMQHTAIEYYLLQKGAKTGNLIRYLKGQTDVLFL